MGMVESGGMNGKVTEVRAVASGQWPVSGKTNPTAGRAIDH
jgi:hypothetical protein